jgi:hypothetical protein
MSGGLSGRIIEIDANGIVCRELPVGYSAELRFHAHTREVVILESAASPPADMRYYLRVVDADRLQEIVRREIPVRPMYAGFPGRSVAAAVSRTGRYIYFLRSGPVIEQGEDLVFRLTPIRWDRGLDRLEVAAFHIDSCHVDYGLTGATEEELFLHLCCECASTVAIGSFQSPRCDWLRMEDLPRREHGPLETTSSWLNAATGDLYCVNRAGVIYEVSLRHRTRRVLASLPLVHGRAVPVHQICGAGQMVHVGVAVDDAEMGLGMVTEIWSVCVPSGEILEPRMLPHPVMNFVLSADASQFAAVDPYTQSAWCIDFESGREIWSLDRLGGTPAELIAIH